MLFILAGWRRGRSRRRMRRKRQEWQGGTRAE
jgi:hypothetical protein